MLRKLAGYLRQNLVAHALREICRVAHPLFMRDWLNDVDLRRASMIISRFDGHRWQANTTCPSRRGMINTSGVVHGL